MFWVQIAAYGFILMYTNVYGSYFHCFSLVVIDFEGFHGHLEWEVGAACGPLWQPVAACGTEVVPL